MKKFPYSKSMRLRQSNQYRWIQRQGHRLAGQYMMIQWHLGPGGHRVPRLGITVSGKYGPSVARNLFRRRIKEIFRQGMFRLILGTTIHVRPQGVAKFGREVVDYQTLEKEWWQLLEKAGLAPNPQLPEPS